MRSELWDSFNTVHKGDPDFSVKTLDLLSSLCSELCHDFPQASLWLYFHSSAEIQQIPDIRGGISSGKGCLSLQGRELTLSRLPVCHMLVNSLS